MKSIASIFHLRLLLVITAISFCPRMSVQAQIHPGPQVDSRSEFLLALFFMPAAPHDLDAIVQKNLRDFPALRLVIREPDGALPVALVRTNRLDLTQSALAPPDPDYLALYGHGLDSQQVERLQNAEEALQLFFVLPTPTQSEGHRIVHHFVAQLARDTRGMIWDEECGELFASDAWDARRAIPDEDTQINLLQQITLRFTPGKGNLLRLVSHGMRKFGLPDLCLDSLPRAQSRQGGRALNTIALALANGAPLDDKGTFILRRENLLPLSARRAILSVVHAHASSEVVVRLVPAKRQAGDPENRLLEISPSPYFGVDDTARLSAMMYAFFGGEVEAVEGADSAAYREASERARQRIPEWRKRLAAGLLPGELLCVKVTFPTPDGGGERMWVEVLRWPEEGPLAGILQNEPIKAEGLQEGQQIKVEEKDILDILFIRSDGTFEGNETGRLLSP